MRQVSVFLRRLSVGSAALCLVGIAGCSSSPVEPDAALPDGFVPDTRPAHCVGDEDCDDGAFCNGHERCEPANAVADEHGCVPSPGDPCLSSQLCNESTRECTSDCDFNHGDADGDGQAARNCSGLDCDDADPLRYPGATEVCDDEGRDEDCDPTTVGVRDLDRDGVTSSACCNTSDTDVETCGTDCNDVARGVRPTATETCNQRDDDCNDSIDEGATVSGYADADRDLHGDPHAARMICLGALGGSALNDDCDDTSVAAHGAQLEICDMIDNDCDGFVDEHARPVTWYLDGDADGYGSAASGTMVSCSPLDGYSLLGTDCDDDNASIHPAAAERCNGLDDDCDGLLNGMAGPGDFEDDDGDGHVDHACGGDDCDDQDWSAYAGAPEICDFRDSDCDLAPDYGAMPPASVMPDATAEVDWFLDVDQDGWGAGTPIHACEPQAGRVTRGGDCADDDYMRYPGAHDACNGRDDDCDTHVDEDAPVFAYYADDDGDHDGAGAPTLACRAPAGFTDLPGDCAPADPTRGPSVIEICDGADQDCDAAIDERLFRDVDGDGHGDPDAPVTGACTTGDVGLGDDCDDTDPRVGATGTCAERCNGRDDDGDGVVDGPGATCPHAAGTMWTCTGGACHFGGCNPLFGDCNGVTTDGCEADLSADPRRCGSCTRVCDVGLACSTGVCADDPIVELACGASTTVARRRSGTMVFWGDGGIAAGTTIMGTDFRPRAHDLASVQRIEMVSVAVGVGCATVAGERRCWGGHWNGYYTRSVLGDGTEGEISLPTAILPGPFDDLGVAVDHTCGVEPTGQVVCWGRGDAGQLGDGLGAHALSPVGVLGLVDAASVEAGRVNTCVIRRSGRVLCWGDGTQGQLGIGTYSSWLAPSTEVELESGGLLGSVAGLAVGSDRIAVCAWRTDGTVFCWGNGFAGQLGAGVSDVHARAIPVALTGVREIDVGNDFFCALHGTPGRISCWGSGDYGQLGNGALASSDVPVAVSLPGDATDFCVGSDHACALLSDGRVYCWGHDTSGQVGFDPTGGDTSIETPVEVASLRLGPP